MASGSVHRHNAKIVGLLVSVGALYIAGSRWIETGWLPSQRLLTDFVEFVFALGFLSEKIHPDWDQQANAPLWRRPYADLMPHRSMWSHGPFGISTIWRVLYVLALPFMVGVTVLVGYSFFTTDQHLLDLFVWYANVWLLIPLRDVGMLFAGLAIADTIHWMRDTFRYA